ncbi:hypothetical protein GQX74_007407 [Glossina fuscipes]|nr:hypothetical protein GQX74_007407 [Glossina fuscipes]
MRIEREYDTKIVYCQYQNSIYKNLKTIEKYISVQLLGFFTCANRFQNHHDHRHHCYRHNTISSSSSSSSSSSGTSSRIMDAYYLNFNFSSTNVNENM